MAPAAGTTGAGLTAGEPMAARSAVLARGRRPAGRARGTVAAKAAPAAPAPRGRIALDRDGTVDLHGSAGQEQPAAGGVAAGATVAAGPAGPSHAAGSTGAARAALGQVALDRVVGQGEIPRGQVDAAAARHHRRRRPARRSGMPASPTVPFAPVAPAVAAGRVVPHRHVGHRHVAAVDQHAAAQRRGPAQGPPSVARPPAIARPWNHHRDVESPGSRRPGWSPRRR